MPTLLVVDYDTNDFDMMKSLLVREGYTVRYTDNNRDAYTLVVRERPDLCLINLGIQSPDGLSLCRRIRRNPQAYMTPVIFLSGAESTLTTAEVLSAGGDDCLHKPFIIKELAARIRAHLRRATITQNDKMPVIELNPNALTARVDGRQVMLTRVEYDLLSFLCNSPHELHSTETLLTYVWQYPDGTGDSALVRNHIRNLRRKLELDPDHPTLIQSRHGRGYTIKAQVRLRDTMVGGMA
ncbi:MAG: response regulator transcription factor [Anaerolineaceae bacterium]|nr:response regulator transcription factor [Anaerolineaceae bacterium]